MVATLVFVGFAALAVELFLIPGFGVAGVLGVAFLVGGGVAAWLLFGSLWGGLVIVCLVVAALLMTVGFFRSGLFRKRLVLSTSLQQGGGTESVDYSGLVGATDQQQGSPRFHSKEPTPRATQRKSTARRVLTTSTSRRQAPPGIKITPRAFGKDRRIPIINRYKSC